MTEREPFTPGERVEITDGPFETLTGEIKEVNNKREMLKVMVRLQNSPRVKVGFGEVPVELRFREVRKII
jgi:transcription antitermination factor NusG